MKKKLLSLLLALCLVMALVPMTVFAEDAQNINVWDGSTAAAFAGGTGTAEDPYQIANGAQLAYLASSVNKRRNLRRKELCFDGQHRPERAALDTDCKFFF